MAYDVLSLSDAPNTEVVAQVKEMINLGREYQFALQHARNVFASMYDATETGDAQYKYLAVALGYADTAGGHAAGKAFFLAVSTANTDFDTANDSTKANSKLIRNAQW